MASAQRSSGRGGSAGGATPVRVLVVDDHLLVREGVRRALAGAEDLEIVGEAGADVEVLPLVRRTRPDLVLLDLQMPGAVACLERLGRRRPRLKVVVLSESRARALIRSAVRRGASGFVSKTIDPADLPSVLREVSEDTVAIALGPTLTDPEWAPPGLGRGDGSILNAVARGLSNRAIARQLGVAESTVKFRLSKIYRTLGVRNRTQAARYVFSHGLDERRQSAPSDP